MSDTTPLEYPNNRIVAVFNDVTAATAARTALAGSLGEEAEIKLYSGDGSAEEVDTSAKWFADTDLDIARFKRALEAGNAILSVPVENDQQRETTNQTLADHGATLATHFGNLTNTTENLNPDKAPKAE